MDTAAKIKEKLGAGLKNWSQHSKSRIYFEVEKEKIRDAVRILFKELGLRFCTATAIDSPDGFEIIYHFSDDKTGVIFNVRVFIKGRKDASVDSISPILRAAEWIEREIWELFGIDFKGHPDLRRLLLGDEWPKDEYPMRKDYKKPHEK